jgi:hypothetical protein
MAPAAAYFDMIIAIIDACAAPARTAAERQGSAGHKPCHFAYDSRPDREAHRSMMREIAAPVGFEQHAFDDAGVDIVGLEVFDRRHGIAAFLDRNAVIDNVTPAHVLALVIGHGKRLVTASKVLIFSHLALPKGSKNWPAGNTIYA